GQISAVVRVMLALPRLASMSRTHCEVADALAERLDVGDSVRRGLGQVFERWNGKGAPNRVRGEAIALPVRVVLVAETAVLAERLGGVEAVKTVMRERAGKALDPKLSALCRERAEDLLPCVGGLSTWSAALAAEPEPVRWIE